MPVADGNPIPFAPPNRDKQGCANKAEEKRMNAPPKNRLEQSAKKKRNQTENNREQRPENHPDHAASRSGTGRVRFVRSGIHASPILFIREKLSRNRPWRPT